MSDYRVVATYQHHDGRIGVMAEFACGSDFTARTDEFREYTRNVLMALAFVDHEAWDALDEIQCVHDDRTIGDYTAHMRQTFHETIGVVRRERWVVR